MTDQELRDLVASIAKSQAETDRQIKQVNKQLGELGNKFGSGAEGMALPSMEKILYQQFKMDVMAPRAKARQNGKTLEIDVLAYGAFELLTPKNFKPQAFTAPSEQNGKQKAKRKSRAS